MDGRPMDCQPALYEGRVVEVSDPHNFWIQIAQVGGLDDFRQLSTDLSLFAERVGTLTSIGGLEKGVHVLVQSKDKDKPVWMRAQISRINHKREEIDVFFNDYGQMEKVSCTQICSACPHFYFLLPWQAWKCGLAGIRPISQTWPHRAIRQFKIIVMDQVLRVAIIAYHSLVQFVALYTLQGESVAHMLLKEEMAQEDNIELVPRTASEVVYVLPEAYMQQARMMEAGYDEDADGEAAVHQAGQGEVSEEMDVAQLYPQVREGGEELGERRSSSRSTPGAVIPEFDMGLISSTKKTDEKMLRMELERRKFMEAKHHLDKEMLQAKQGVPEEALAAVTDLAWGMKDEHLMKDGWVSHQEVATRISQEIRKADDMWEKELAQRPPPPSQKSSSSGKKRGDLGQKGSPNHSPGARGPVRRKLDYQQKPAASVVMVSASASTASAHAASAKVNANLAISPSAPAPLRTKTVSNLSDEERSILVASFAACLDEQDNDAEIAKWSLSAYVQPDEKEQPKGLDILLEFLVGEAVHCPEREDMCLSIISSYSDSYNAGTLLAQALWRLSNDFMMMPASGKNPLCKRFGRVVGKLSLSSHQWAYRNHEVLAAETLELLALWLEKCLESLKEGRAGTVSRQFEVLLEGAMELWRQGQLSLEPSSTTATIHQLLKQLLVVDQLDRPRREQLLKMLLSSWDSVKLESMPPKLMKEMVRKAKPPCAEKSTQTPDPRLSHASCQTEEVLEPRRGGLDRQNSQPGYGQGRTTPVTTPSLWAYRTWVGNVDQAGATIGCSSLLEKYNISNFLVSDLAVQDAQNHEHNTESDEDRDLDNEDFREQHQTAYDREEMGSPESEGPYYEDQDDGDAAEHSGYGQEGEDQEYGEPMAPPGEREEVYGTAHIQESNFYEDDEIYNSDEEGSYQEEDDDKPSADQRDGDSFERRDAENDHTSQASKWSQYARDLQSGDGNVPVDEEDSDRWHYDEGNALPSDLQDKCTVEDGSPSKAQPQGSGEDSPFEMLEDYPYDQIEEEPISADAEYTDQPPNLQGSKAAPDELYSPWPHSDAESAKPGRPQEGHWENVTPGRGFQRHLPGLHRSAALRAHWDPMPMFTTKTLAAMMLPSPKPAPIQPPPAEASPEEEPPVEEEEEEEEEDPPLQPVQMSMSPSFPPDQGPGVPGAGGPEVMSWSKLLSSSTSASSGAPYSFQHGSLSRFVAPRGRDNSAARMMSMQVPAGLKRTYEERSKLKHVENPSPSPTLEHSFSASSQLVESPEKEEENLEPIPTQGKQSSHPVEQLPALGLGHPVPADAFSPWLLQPPQVAPIQIPVTKLGQFGAIGSRKPQYRERGRGRSQAPHPNMLPHPQWDSPPRHGRGVYPDWKYEYEHLGMRDQAPEEQKPKPKPRVDPSSKLLIQEYLRDSDNKQKGQESEFPTLMDANPAPIAIGVVDSSAGKPADTMASIAFDLLGDGSGRRGGGGDNGSNSSGGGGGIGSGGGGGGGLGANGGVSMEGRTQGPAAALDGAMKWSSHGEGDVNYMGPGRLPAYAESMPWNTFRPIQLPDGRDQEGFGTKDFQYPDHRETFDSPRLRNGVELVRSPKDWQAPGARREPARRMGMAHYAHPGPPVSKLRGHSWAPKEMACTLCGLPDHETFNCPSKHENFFL